MKILQFLNDVVIACRNLFFTRNLAGLGEIARRGAPVGVLRFLLGGARTCDYWIFRLLILPPIFRPWPWPCPRAVAICLEQKLRNSIRQPGVSDQQRGAVAAENG
jgi:hypothetical protein